MNSGTMYDGIPLGQKCLKYPNPFRHKPMTIDAMNTAIAKPSVTISWLVNENANGRRPKTFPRAMKRKSEQTYGRRARRFFSESVFITPCTNPIVSSTMTCLFPGINPRSLVPTKKTASIARTVPNINKAEFVIDKSKPNKSIGMILFTSNEDIKSVKYATRR
jgi:hypothetical protein